jgi:Cd2+/Zn2+-exporting ATPase
VGLDCAEEVLALRHALEPLEGVDELGFDLLSQRLTVHFDRERIGVAALGEAIGRTGMRAVPWTDADAQPAAASADRWRDPRLWLAAAGAASLVLGVLWHLLSGGALLPALTGRSPPDASRALYVFAAVAGLLPLLPKAVAAVRGLRPDMHLLMAVAIAGALLLGDALEAGTVGALFALSLQLESWSIARARRAVAALLDLSPREAEMLHEPGPAGVAAGEDDGDPAHRHGHRVPAAQVAPGSLVRVRPGERVPLDGQVVAGRSEVDESPITGESRPVAKQPGDEAFAGTINGRGALELRTTRPADDTMLARITRLVVEAQSRRGPSERFVERFARVYTPVVLALAALAAVVPPLLLGRAWGTSIYDALVLLVIACPCALVISTPVSVVCALASAARRGVLVKGGRLIEAPATIRALALDKTGTLTTGRPVVTRVIPFDHHDEHDLLCRAAAIETRSRHPLGEAIVARAQQGGCPHLPARDVRALPGRGAEATLEGRAWWIGSHRLLEERGQETPEVHATLERLEAEGRSVVILGNERHVCGLIVLEEQPRAEAAAAIAALHALGIQPIVMLTGDTAGAARALGARLGLDEVRAGLLPQDKLAEVRALVERHGAVAMVGDGVNDAPALAASHLGVALGAAGSDVAIETADVVIMSDDLARLPWLIRHSRRTVAIIRANIAASLAIKAAFIVSALLGWASLWGAIAADMGVSLIVVVNAMRLLGPSEADPAPQTP